MKASLAPLISNTQKLVTFSKKSLEVTFSHQFMYRFRTKSNSYEIVSPILLLYL